ncbi:MAG: GAF domain-containing protein [Chloroflexi bacterium]|nr:GAF domain-containing protein [Chloroflexota bacterium]
MNTFKRFTPPPVFEDEEKNRIAGLLNSILVFVIAITALVAPLLFAFTTPDNRLPLLILLIPFLLFQSAAYILLRRGYVAAAANIFLVVIGVAIFGSYLFSDIRSTGALLGLIIVIAFTTLLLRPRAILILLGIIILITLLATLSQMQGWFKPAFSQATNPLSNWISNSIVFVLASLGFYLSSLSLRQALDAASASRKRLEANNRELTALRDALEIRVQERTAALEKRASQLQAVSSVARAIASVQDLDALLPEITRLVSERFGFYHVGIFLLDETGEHAVLRAANSQGGWRMLNRKHQLKLDEKSIVGFATSRGEPRLASDVGTDSVFFNNPDLPDTRSEMALPLRVGRRVIGALDVQSTQPNAFTAEDIGALATLADQVAIAIENAHLFSQARKALRESEAMFGKYVRQEWNAFARRAVITGYLFDGKHTMPLEDRDKRDKTRVLPQTGRLTLEKDAKELIVPIRLQGQTIGYLEAKPKSGNRKWTQDDLALLEAAAERAALALENARLVDSAQRRASRERTIGEISSRLGALSDTETIMQAAVEELGRRIGGTAEVIFELEQET